MRHEGLRKLHVVVQELHQLLPDEAKQALEKPPLKGGCTRITQIISTTPAKGAEGEQAAAEEILQSLVCLEHLAAGLEAATATGDSGAGEAAGAAGTHEQPSAKTGRRYSTSCAGCAGLQAEK